MTNQQVIINLIKANKLGRGSIIKITGCTGYEYTMALNNFTALYIKNHIRVPDDKIIPAEVDKNELDGYGESFKKLLN